MRLDQARRQVSMAKTEIVEKPGAAPDALHDKINRVTYEVTHRIADAMQSISQATHDPLIQKLKKICKNQFLSLRRMLAYELGDSEIDTLAKEMPGSPALMCLRLLNDAAFMSVAPGVTVDQRRKELREMATTLRSAASWVPHLGRPWIPTTSAIL